MMRPRTGLALLIAGGLAACASKRHGPPDDEPTLKTLAGRQVVVAPDHGVKSDVDKTIAAYREFLEAAPKAPQRAQALRRLGDLEMDSADDRVASGQAVGTADDYREAVKRYEDLLKTFPDDPTNDRVLYQLARAQELGGEMEKAQRTLDRLVRDYPKTVHFEEAQFRRGEMLFAMRDYPKAEQAFATVLRNDDANPYRERALYMQGWSLFKQGRLDEALHPFFGVLDGRIANTDPNADDETIEKSMTRADRELVEDTFRVMSLCLQNLQGAASIPPYVTTDARRNYEFRVYEALGNVYLKQDRPKDAADTFTAFAKAHPNHARSPVLQARVIEIYEQAGFGNLALATKKDFVSRYAADSDFRRDNEAGWQRARPVVKTHLSELSQNAHAAAQKSKSPAEYQEAVRWYRAWLVSFPDDPEAARQNFLLAELLYEDRRYSEAAAEYEKAAYGYPKHDKSADAGYAALLSYAAQEKGLAGSELQTLQRRGVESARRFQEAFPTDSRVAVVLTNAAEKLYAMNDGEAASPLAEQVLRLDPPAPLAQKRVAWTVIAHSAFDRGAFERAEGAYKELLALVPEKDAGRPELVERLAASVYKQGEQARAAGNARDAVGHFERVAAVAPQATVRANAQYDAAAALIGLKDWDGAAKSLEDFRQRYPNHPLAAEVGGKLVVAYLEQKQWAGAAGELEKLSATKNDPATARAALWQAAELYERANARVQAGNTWERYVKQFPQPLEPALEARWHLASIAKDENNAVRELALMADIAKADRAGGGARTDRTRYLGAKATLALAKPAVDEYRKVALVEPLQKQLKLKKSKMEEVLKAYAAAAEYGVADVTTAATYHTAEVYRDFGKALMDSERPKKLSKEEREQYDVMLEEQAFPFEEKAIELHETNARRTAAGIYGPAIRDSFAALAKLRPVRYGKLERMEGTIDAIR